MPEMMQAVLLDDYAEATFRTARVDRPTPGPGQVLVRVVAVGVNPIDPKIRTGKSTYAMPELPAILGTDLAGVVVETGPDVTEFTAGDEVYGLTGGVRGLPGSMAEYAAVDVRLLSRKPANLTLREAAALPLVSLTAWEGLVGAANVGPGDKVLVHAGAGGVGHIGVQLARARGAEVFATASTGKLGLVKDLGATAIDYTTTSVEEYVNAYTGGRGFDVVYDTVGGPVLDQSFTAVRHYGHVASCAAFGTHNLAPASLRMATLHGTFVLLPLLTGERRDEHGRRLREITTLVEQGKIRPVVDPRRFTLETAMDAHFAVENRTGNVKIVIDVADGTV
ncbi:zinc-dependent alcohol dehydrogenase family protein [Actinoplanes sp. NPDC051346]|uniref:zinc-dependent alcohol dehydrogenase family protein n=1 Tax=Actinoplanes sp. NPDC051346 TaxID=3155048 RepID=UPI003414F016